MTNDFLRELVACVRKRLEEACFDLSPDGYQCSICTHIVAKKPDSHMAWARHQDDCWVKRAEAMLAKADQRLAPKKAVA